MPTLANAPEMRLALAMPPELHRGVTGDCFRLHVTPSAYAYAARLLRLQLNHAVWTDGLHQPFKIEDDLYTPPKLLGDAKRGWLALMVCLDNVGPRRVLEVDGRRSGQSAEAYLSDSVHLLHDLIQYDVTNPVVVTRANKEPAEIGLLGLPHGRLNILRTGAMVDGKAVGKVLSFNQHSSARAGDSNNFGA